MEVFNDIIKKLKNVLFTYYSLLDSKKVTNPDKNPLAKNISPE